MSKALKDVRQLYLETAPLIYYVEEHPTYLATMDALIAAVDQASIVLVSSVITLTEVLTQPIRLGNTQLVQSYRSILSNSNGFRLLAVTAETADVAANLRARYALRTPDALHVATAITTGCDALVTNDAALRRVAELRVFLLDDLEPDPPTA
ncbi:MAG: type II toxin-antitoxin system VapC family toxin [Roseiflexaceae bacterium]|nr:type II toxin-antitoxin system VapC family toxin [Roseiflexaceae bacterium]